MTMSRFTGTVLGICAGGLAGTAVVSPKALYKPADMMMRAKVRVGLLIGAALGGIVGGWLCAPAALAAAPSSPAPASPPNAAPPNAAPSSGVFITLIPDQSTASEGVKIGATVSVQPPAGAQWADPATNAPYGSATPVTWPYAGPGTVLFSWYDASGKFQQTTMTFYTVS